ncbi:hypothetical protein CJF42_25010 [Pseudoalteromonas sp. NBT06-2]|uniref:hypothetical protein n=1 Tax=Pseudoalteromonas sp. NBT06-2 TaxID=2025950 RepID=UPI000BA7D716|nr:hypothetical protein [Pseudoalteromonas sp. NBT06-2]PAJ71757.1 hypothetical protein CJF42_25010 [Pseudoalteromonas sp. NBT06-2]
MTTLNKEQAIQMLGEYAFNQRTGAEITSRIETLIKFSEKNSNVSVEINNNWSEPPRSSSVKSKIRLGGTTYQYQVWAVVR